MSYKYLVVSALQEELDEFLLRINPHREQLEDDVVLCKCQVNHNSIVEVLTFSADRMGMPYNAAKLMQVILRFRPTYVLFIGICAGLKNHSLGSVLIPRRAFSYESGKYENGNFYPDYTVYDTSGFLRKTAQSLKTENLGVFGYAVTTDEDFCSGSAVISDNAKVQEIKDNGARKLSGLEMEAYAVACINEILKPNCELLVIKSISDKAIDKDVTDEAGAREKAKKNAADFALRLIKYIEERKLGNKKVYELTIHTYTSDEPDRNYKLKLKFNIKNETSFPITIESLSFNFSKENLMDPKVKMKKSKPSFYYNKDVKGNEIYRDVYILQPGDEIKTCWLPIDPKIGELELKKLHANKKIGAWSYKCNFLDSLPFSKTFSLNV